jgi:hypothetical protein
MNRKTGNVKNNLLFFNDLARVFEKKLQARSRWFPSAAQNETTGFLSPLIAITQPS